MSLTAFFFPVKQEASGLLRRLKNVRKEESDGVTSWQGEFQGRQTLVVLLGMGGDSVRRTLPSILKKHSIDFAWVAGFGGGLDASLKKGDVALALNFSTPHLHFSKYVPVVQGVTVNHVVASSTQKLALAKGHQAQVVDMESEIAHRLFEEKGIRHATLRGISDPWDESLPSGALNASFDPELNRPTPLKLLIHLVIHPGDFFPFFRFVVGLSRVQKNLTMKLLELEERREKQ
jgi:nucleoside phosphorylase